MTELNQNTHDTPGPSAWPFALAVLGIIVVWAFVVSNVGFAAFIYPLLGLVAATFAFCLFFTRGS